MKTLKKDGTKNIAFDNIAINEQFIYNNVYNILKKER